MIYFLSLMLPNHMKSQRWINWENRVFYHAALSVYRNKEKAYYVLRLTVSTQQLIEQCRASRKAAHA